MDANELKYWVSFNRVPRVGRARFNLLENYFGTLERAWHAGGPDLKAAGLDSRTVQLIVGHRDAIDPGAELDRLREAGVRALTWYDDEYPPRLKEIYDRPPVLYVRGEILPEDERSVAVVGTRRPTAYGREAGHRLTFDIVFNNRPACRTFPRGMEGIL